MAKSGSNTTTIASYLFLDLSWEDIETDVAGNRTKVRLTLKLRHTGTGVYFSASKSGVLHGTSFTYTGGFSGSGTKTLNTRDVWVTHNSDGSKSQTFTASFSLNITYSGAYRGTSSVSVTASLDTIPRASSLTAFAMGNSLQINTTNVFTLTISRPTGSTFTHDLELRDGSYVLQSWRGLETPSSLTLNSTNVNILLDRMSSVTSRSLTLRLQTKSGSTNIGSAVTRNATVTVNSNVKPAATTPTVNIYGSGKDKDLNKYVQNITRVSASFTPTARGGATVVSTKIVVKRLTDTQTITGSSGTTSRAITRSGSYTVVASVTDSRGRTTESTAATFTADAYSPPSIRTFTVERRTSTPTTMEVYRVASWSSLGGTNSATELIRSRLGVGGAWTNKRNTTTSTGSISGTVSYTGYPVTNSYEFTMTLTDAFGNSATAATSASTQSVVLDVYRDVGVGIGKIWERGVLDVGGSIYMNDQLLTNLFAPTSHSHSGYASSSHNHSASEITSGTLSYLRIPRGTTSTTLARGNHTHSEYEVEVGSNTSGRWAKFPNGVMICTANVSVSSSNFVELNTTVSGDIKRSRLATVSMPQSFSTVWYVNFGVLGGTATSIRGNILGTKLQYGSSTQTPLTSSWSAPAFFHTSTISTSTTAGFVFFAIGSY